MAGPTRKKQNTIALTSGIVLIIFIVVFSILSSIKKVIPDGTVGAMAGNLNNDGLFCESDGIVYFANSYDENCLYSMNPDQTEVKKIYNLGAKFINAAAGYVIFYGEIIKQSTGLGSVLSKPGMYMVKSNGRDMKALTSNTSQNMIVVGNNVYYQHYTYETGTTFAKIDVKKKKSTELLDYMINPSSYYDGKIYYNGMYDDHYLYTYDIASGEVEAVWEGDIWYPIRDGDYIYYLDVRHDYRLCRYSLSENQIEVLANERIDCYNLYNGIIFYQKSSASDPCLKRMNADGSNVEIIANGVFNSINITSTYTYFKEFGDDYNTYFTPTLGSGDVFTFDAAKTAMIKNSVK